jgi:isopentenyl-diphosphate Delta-isomerase
MIALDSLWPHLAVVKRLGVPQAVKYFALNVMHPAMLLAKCLSVKSNWLDSKSSVYNLYPKFHKVQSGSASHLTISGRIMKEINNGHEDEIPEMFDLVDAFGFPTGEVADRDTVHAEGLLHRDMHVWITNGEDMLQQQRSWEKDIMPGEWDISVAGHIGAGESYRDAAGRETFEELGVELPDDSFIEAGTFASELLLPGWEQPHNVVGDNFVVVAPELNLNDLDLQEEEVVDVRWYPIDQLEQDLSDPETAEKHASQPLDLYQLGIDAMRRAASEE